MSVVEGCRFVAGAPLEKIAALTDGNPTIKDLCEILNEMSIKELCEIGGFYVVLDSSLPDMLHIPPGFLYLEANLIEPSVPT